MSCPVLRVEQMAEADRLSMAAGTPGISLMQSAGEAVAREVTAAGLPHHTMACSQTVEGEAIHAVEQHSRHLRHLFR